MATADYLPESLDELDRFLHFLAKARTSAGVLDAVRGYLARWTAGRVARVQSIDAGWAPFDDNQRPTPIVGALDVRQVHEALHDQVESLRESGVAPTPEILELELVFFFANFLLDDLEPEFLAARAPDVRPENRAAAAR